MKISGNIYKGMPSRHICKLEIHMHHRREAMQYQQDP